MSNKKLDIGKVNNILTMNMKKYLPKIPNSHLKN